MNDPKYSDEPLKVLGYLILFVVAMFASYFAEKYLNQEWTREVIREEQAKEKP